MLGPIFGAALLMILLCIIMPFIVRRITWQPLRYVLMSLLLLQVAIGVGVMFTEPYTLEAITNRGGRSIGNPHMIINPMINWLFLASILTGWLMLFTRDPLYDGWLSGNSTELVVTALLIAGGFYFWAFNSIKWMDDEKREKIYYELGGYG